ncbi:hypothetical protein IMY05_C4588000100 [Salix suchowensis]|nr:hypothetical protein IMY05_C4588000100 [Salix suchowensis]
MAIERGRSSYVRCSTSEHINTVSRTEMHLRTYSSVFHCPPRTNHTPYSQIGSGRDSNHGELKVKLASVLSTRTARPTEGIFTWWTWRGMWRTCCECQSTAQMSEGLAHGPGGARFDCRQESPRIRWAGAGLMRRTHSSLIPLIRWAAQILCHGDLPQAIYITLKSQMYLPFVASSKRQLVTLRLRDFCIAPENLVINIQLAIALAGRRIGHALKESTVACSVLLRESSSLMDPAHPSSTSKYELTQNLKIMQDRVRRQLQSESEVAWVSWVVNQGLQRHDFGEENGAIIDTVPIDQPATTTPPRKVDVRCDEVRDAISHPLQKLGVSVARLVVARNRRGLYTIDTYTHSPQLRG